jgi:hypothetical protein
MPLGTVKGRAAPPLGAMMNSLCARCDGAHTSLPSHPSKVRHGDIYLARQEGRRDMAQRSASNRRTFVFGIVLAPVVLAMTWASYDWAAPIGPTEAIYQPQHLILY